MHIGKESEGGDAGVEIGRGSHGGVGTFPRLLGRVQLERVVAEVERVGLDGVAELARVAGLGLVKLLVLEEVVRRLGPFLGDEILRLTAQATGSMLQSRALVVVLEAG